MHPLFAFPSSLPSEHLSSGWGIGPGSQLRVQSLPCDIRAMADLWSLRPEGVWGPGLVVVLPAAPMGYAYVWGEMCSVCAHVCISGLGCGPQKRCLAPPLASPVGCCGCCKVGLTHGLLPRAGPTVLCPTSGQSLVLQSVLPVAGGALVPPPTHLAWL